MKSITLDLHLNIFVIMYFIIIGIYSFISRKKLKTMSTKLIILRYLFIFYILSVIKLTILPITISFEKIMVYPSYSIYQIIPFKTIVQVIKYNTWKVQLIGNILLLYPLPIFMGLLNCKKNNIFIKSILVSVFIEITQLLINLITKCPNKIFDVDDLILNIIGIGLGYITLNVFVKYKERVL